MRAKKNIYQNGGEQRDPRLKGGIYDGPEGNKRQYAAYRKAMEMLGPVHKSDMSEKDYHEKAVDLAYDIMDQEMRMSYEAQGGQGASATEDLLERLTQYKRNAYGNKYEQGGEVKKKDSTKRLAGQYFSPIASDEEYRDYVLYIPDYEGDMTNMVDTDFRKLEMAGAKRIYLPTDERGQAADRRISTVNVNGRAMLADEDFKVSEVGGKSVLVPAYDQGGKVNGETIKIAGQYAVDSIKSTPEGKQYVSMELPDGKVVPVFGDWETYGNPDQEGRIEDLDFRIYPLGDGTYALDAAEAEADMLRAESREVSRQAGPNVEDLLQELNQRGGMGFTPQGRMRPVKRQR